MLVSQARARAHLLAAAYPSSSEHFVSLVWFSSSGFPFVPPPSFSGQSSIFFSMLAGRGCYRQGEGEGKCKADGVRKRFKVRGEFSATLKCANHRKPSFHSEISWNGGNVTMRHGQNETLHSNKICSFPVYAFISSFLLLSHAVSTFLQFQLLISFPCLYSVYSLLCQGFANAAEIWSCWASVGPRKPWLHFPKVKKKIIIKVKAQHICWALAKRSG